MIFGGFKYTLDMYKAAHDPSSPDHDKGVHHLNCNHVGFIPNWAVRLDWSAGHHTLPQPFEEITMEEWMLFGICGHESVYNSLYEGLHIPGEFEWLGGWPCHIHLYGTYGLIDAHMHGHPEDVDLGKGHRIRRDKYVTYTIRYFRIGCDHR